MEPIKAPRPAHVPQRLDFRPHRGPSIPSLASGLFNNGFVQAPVVHQSSLPSECSHQVRYRRRPYSADYIVRWKSPFPWSALLSCELNPMAERINESPRGRAVVRSVVLCPIIIRSMTTAPVIAQCTVLRVVACKTQDRLQISSASLSSVFLNADPVSSTVIPFHTSLGRRTRRAQG